MLKGYRTLIINAIALLVALAAGFGIVIDVGDAEALGLGVFALINILLRFKTDTPVGGAPPLDE